MLHVLQWKTSVPDFSAFSNCSWLNVTVWSWSFGQTISKSMRSLMKLLLPRQSNYTLQSGSQALPESVQSSRGLCLKYGTASRHQPVTTEFVVWPIPCSGYSVRVVPDETVKRLRTGFLQRAVLRVRQLAAHGDMEDALNASSELRHYFEGVKENLSAGERAVFFRQIQTLPKPTEIRDNN